MEYFLEVTEARDGVVDAAIRFLEGNPSLIRPSVDEDEAKRSQRDIAAAAFAGAASSAEPNANELAKAVLAPWADDLARGVATQERAIDRPQLATAIIPAASGASEANAQSDLLEARRLVDNAYSQGNQ